jgi:hypothetical protein
MVFTQQIFSRKPEIACLSTTPGIIVTIDGQQQHLGEHADIPSAAEAIEKVLIQRPALTPNDFIRLENPMRDNITEARALLEHRVLPPHLAATSQDKRKVILFMGAAMDIQTGRNTLIHNQRGTNRIIPRLDTLHLPSNLKADYELVHEYYNATKHGNKSVHQKLLAEIGSPEGRVIATKYFEFVRRIFEWYYQTQGVPPTAEIKPIDYAPYGIVF